MTHFLVRKPFRMLMLIFGFAVLFAGHAQAEILFEAYYRIDVKNENRGYVIQQLSQDATTQTIRYYTVRKNNEGYERSAVESVKSLKGVPLKSTSWTRQDNLTAQATATFKGKGVNVQYFGSDLKKALRDEDLQWSKGATISSFVLNELQAKNKEWKTPQKYEAFVEENMRFADGEVLSRGDHEFQGLKIRHLEDSLLSEEIELFVFQDGNVMASRSEDQKQLVYLVRDQKTATSDMPFFKDEVIGHFGGRIPDGKMHPLVDLETSEVRNFVDQIPTSIRRTPSQASAKAGAK